MQMPLPYQPHFRIKRADGKYLMALTPKTDQAVWCTSPAAALTLADSNQVNALMQKLRGRNERVRWESFTPDPSPPEKAITQFVERSLF